MKTMRVRQAGGKVAITRERDGYVGRTGVTLTEVLMSVMIMSIGVVSVATLFPLSTLRVLEASRQTNSTIVRFGAEALIDVDPSFVHNPDGLTGYNSAAFRGQVYFVDPYGWQTLHSDAGFPAAVPAGPLTPNPTTLLRDTLGQITTGSPVNWPLPRRYNGGTAELFTYATPSVNPYPTTSPASESAIARALQLVGQPDNWKVITESTIVSATSATGISTVTLDTDADLSTVVPQTGVYYRAVIYDVDGLHSEIRSLTSTPTNQQLAWTPDLPARFGTAASPNIGKVRVEVLDETYTWALSVRKRGSGVANVDVVVFLKRSFNTEHEYVYPAPFRRYTLGADGKPGVAGVNDNNNFDSAGNPIIDEVAEIGYPGSDDLPNTAVTVDFSTLPAGSNPPAFRRGGYVCDTKNGLWYRIQGIQAETATSVTLVLDKFIQQDGTEDVIPDGTLTTTPTPPPPLTSYEDANGNGLLDQGGIYWNPTVVNVFPLEIKEP